MQEHKTKKRSKEKRSEGEGGKELNYIIKEMKSKIENNVSWKTKETVKWKKKNRKVRDELTKQI